MKILVIGATGTIGQAIVNELSPRHEIVAACKKQGPVLVDITNEASIRVLFEQNRPFDAVVCAAGSVPFAPLKEMTYDLYLSGFQSKLMGQVRLVLIGQEYINDNGSFTLTSGILSDDPIRFGSAASTVNGALNSFVKAASIELDRGIRVNAVSPTVITESLPKSAQFFRGFRSVPAQIAALAYAKSVEGLQTGMVYEVKAC